MTVRDIFDFLNQKFPVKTACDFDNVGIILGNPEYKINNVLITLDCTINAVKEASKNNCELIITHHPVIFNPLKTVLDGTVAYEILKNNISVISMHTNLDVGIGGVNDALCDALKLKDVQTVIADDGFAIRKGSISPVSADDLAKHIKNCLSGGVKYVGCSHLIQNVLVCSGSGGDFSKNVKLNDCDALITADVKHNQFIDAENSDIAIYDAGHFNTENVVIEPLKNLLQQHFAKINFYTYTYSQIKFL